MSKPPQTPTPPHQEDLDAFLIAQMRDDFIIEAREILDRLGPLLADFEKSGDEDQAKAIFRDVHTLKGTAGFVGLEAIQSLAHKIEDLFGALRGGKLSLTTELIDLAFEGLQFFEVVHADLLAGGAGEGNVSKLIQRMDALQHGKVSGKTKISAEPRYSSPMDATGQNTLRVEVKALDQLMFLVGELITRRNALQASAEELKNERLAEITTAIDRLTSQLQSAVTEIRLTPIEMLYNRFIPVVRNLARERDKDVRLLIEGGETPFDRTIFEQMYNPLVHLIRNAIDHGLEPAAERIDAGKPAEGNICLSAERHGEDVLLRISDDGRGINLENIRSAAVKRGLLSQEEAQALSQDQAIRLIFTPGMSTAVEITELSGRGVGMDVVVQNVRRLRGSVDVEMQPGTGTAFVIRLPLSLAVLDVLLVQCVGHIYALPLQVVRETMQLAVEDIHTLQLGRVVFVRDTALPLNSLRTWLKREGEGLDKTVPLKPAVVIRLLTGDVVLLVDALVGRQQVVLQPLNPLLGVVNGVDGTALLPDGSVALILDVEGLAHA